MKGPSQVTPRSYARQAAGLWNVIDRTEASVTPRGGTGKENVGNVGANSRMTPRGTGSAPTAQPVGIRHVIRRISKDCGAGSYARHTACSLRKSGVQESQPPKQLEGAGTTPKDAEIRKLKGLLAATISENEERRSLHCPPGMCPLRHASSPRSSVWSARPSNSNLHRADAVASATASHLCVHSSESSQK